MPLGPGVRYRVKTNQNTGEKVRLAFRGNKVIEAKKLHKKKRRKAEMEALKNEGKE